MKEKTKFKIKGDASMWEVISQDPVSGIIQARNLSNGFVGPIAAVNVIKIFEVATSVIPPEDIKIVDPPEEDRITFGEIKTKKRRGRKKKLL